MIINAIDMILLYRTINMPTTAAAHTMAHIAAAAGERGIAHGKGARATNGIDSCCTCLVVV